MTLYAKCPDCLSYTAVEADPSTWTRCACGAIEYQYPPPTGLVILNMRRVPPAAAPRGTTAWAGAPMQDVLTQLQRRADAHERAIEQHAKQLVALQDNSSSLDRTTEHIYESLHALKDRIDVQERTAKVFAQQLVTLQNRVDALEARPAGPRADVVVCQGEGYY